MKSRALETIIFQKKMLVEFSKPVEGFLYMEVCAEIFFFFFFLSFFGCTRGIWKFPGQGVNPNHSYDQCHGCGIAGSLTLRTGPRIELASPQRQARSLTINPLCHSGNFWCIIFKMIVSLLGEEPEDENLCFG